MSDTGLPADLRESLVQRGAALVACADVGRRPVPAFPWRLDRRGAGDGRHLGHCRRADRRLCARVRAWEIAELVRQADQPLHLKDFAQRIGTKDPSRAAHHVRRAEQTGLMRKMGWVGGWVAMG
ncbi:MAG: hypothetical protein NTW96_11870 [Planctomycetia bacterium]|nr:hypothetical protein [Planctomycetia bacterium]